MKFNIIPEKSESLVKKYLSEDIFKALVERSTATGFTLEKAIQSGIKNPDSAIGIYAGDAESYHTFSAIFEPIILAYHQITQGDSQRSDTRPVQLPDLDPEKRYIRSSRIRIARNVAGFCFTNHIELERRQVLEKQIVEALADLGGELQGEYHSFESLDSQKTAELKRENLLFSKGDRFQEAAGFNADYPLCRGIFVSGDRRFRVWLNEEDQMRIISQDVSSDLAGVYNLLSKSLQHLEGKLDFAKDEHYGYLTSCPTNIGTTMRAGVHIQLKKLNRNRSLLTSLTRDHDLQIRGTRGEKTEVDNAVFDISNRCRFGISEREIVTNLHQGLAVIIDAEKTL